MRATLPLLAKVPFPALRRAQLTTLQVNLGYLCNQTCLHCHVNAGPRRTEIMTRETVDEILAFIDARAEVSPLTTLDLTGGAPEMNPDFKYFVRAARERGLTVMDRCNLTILQQPGYEDMAEFLAEQRCEVVASLPCYKEDNVNAQRGDGVFDDSIAALQHLNRLGYGQPGSGLTLSLVYNPQGASLPPPQAALEADYKLHLKDEFGIVFDQLFTVANMPIQRFGSTLLSKGQFNDYMDLLCASHVDSNLDGVMCRNLISVDWLGYVYDCDFNQMLKMPLEATGQTRTHIRELTELEFEGQPIAVAGHCYGCTAGQGSSCGGALA